MAVLAADVQLEFKGGGDIRAFPVLTATTIYKGSLVTIDANGFAIAGADTASTTCIGVATEQVVNSGASGAKWIRVQTSGCAKLVFENTLVQADVGNWVYVKDSGAASHATGPTNDIPVGVLMEYISATSGWVELGARVTGIAST